MLLSLNSINDKGVSEVLRQASDVDNHGRGQGKPEISDLNCFPTSGSTVGDSDAFYATVAPWTAFAAVRMTSITRPGLESIGTWLLSAS